MKATVIGPIAALIVGVAGGYIVGNKTTTAPEKEKDVAADSRTHRRSSASSSSSGGQSSRSNRVKSAAEAMALPGQNERLQSLMDYYAGLDPSQFEDEAKKLEDLPWSERIMVGYLLFARWGEEDPTAAMAHTKTMGMAGMFVKGTVMQSWAAKYPQDAAKYFTDNPNDFRMGGRGGRGGPGGPGGSSAGVIATEWARQDSSAAMAWAQSLEGRDKRDAVRGIFEQAAKADPAEAASMLSSITDPEALKDAQNSIAREWGSKDWDAAKSWISSLPADQQVGATARALRGLADTDPEAAAAQISAVPEGKERTDVMQNIAREWSREDPSAAATWVMANGTEDAQKESIGRVVSSWVGQDSEAALAFVNSQPDGSIRDQAASSYVMSNQGGDIQSNLKLAETIGDERNRSRAIGMTAVGWMRQDKEAATEYLETTESLSQEAKDRIQRWSNRGRGGRGGQ